MNPLEQIAGALGFPVVVLPVAAAGSTTSAISFLVDCLIKGGFLRVETAEEVRSNVMNRERLGSTALGGGSALPHCTGSSIDRVLGIFARSSCPVPWDAPDGKPVETICLILAPIVRPGDYMRALEMVAQAMREKGA
jgi:nitrogen PTS system EIIA component